MTLEERIREIKKKHPGLTFDLDGKELGWRAPSQKRPCQGCGKKQVREVAAAHPGDPEFERELRARRG